MAEDPNMKTDAIKSLVVDAMMKHLDESKRDELIRQALASLIKVKPGHGYGERGSSPLEDAFGLAVQQVAHEIVREQVASDRIRDQIKVLVAAALEHLFVDQDRIARLLAEKLSAALAWEIRK